MFLRELVKLNGDLEHIFEDSSSCRMNEITPLINLYEKGDKLILKAVLPNIEKKNIKIEVNDNVISICGESKEEKSGVTDRYYRKEIGSGTFQRHIKLPIKVNEETINATLLDGVLTIQLEKHKTEKPKLIQVQ